MGVSFNELVRLSGRSSSLIRRVQRDDNYVLAVENTGGGKHSIRVAFFANSSNAEKAKAYLHGCLARRALGSLQPKELGNEAEEAIQKAEADAESELARLWPIFELCVTEAGWMLDKTECSTEGYELYLE